MATRKKVTKKKVTKKKVAKKATKKVTTKKALPKKKVTTTKKKSGFNPKSLNNLKPAQKGEVRNPSGGRTHDKEKKMLKQMTSKIVKEIINTSLTGNLDDLNAIVKSKESSAMQVGIATALATAIKKGDWSTLERIVEKLVGKETAKFDVTSGGEKISNVSKVLLQLPANGRTKEENE